MEIETVPHLFWECLHVQKFWKDVSDFLREKNIDININFITISFGIFQLYQKSETQVKIFILFLAKYYIFSCKYKKLIPMLSNFKLHLLMRIKIEKEIALNHDRLAYFENKWRSFLNLIV